MEQTITLSKNNPTVRIPVRKEQPYFEITQVVLPPDEDFLKSSNARVPIIRCDLFKGTQQECIFLDFSAAKRNQFSRNLNFNKAVLTQNDSKWDYIEFSCDFERYSFLPSFDVCYSVLPLLISLDTLFDDFSEHFNDYGNCKILFSAPFGQGKTTFLKEYFNNYSQQYEVFHLFPVNYSVASNEDIFRYIKCELIFQLFERNVEFEKIETTFKDALPFYLLKHPLKVIQPLIHLIPKIGGSLVKFLESTEKLGASMKKYAEAHSVDERKDAEQYTKDIFEQEGSIYEDNFYTQLIKQLVEQLHEQGKTTVFIIDDLDRMDPEHIFRIMNVLAAHFDGPEYQMNHHSNKFGFDKIILVADYENLKKIFCHKYGQRTDYKGYIDKFFSKKIFYYKPKDLLLASIYRFTARNSTNKQLSDLYFILQDLVITNSISLREILQLNKLDLAFFKGNRIADSNGRETNMSNQVYSSPYFLYNFFLPLYYLSEVSGIDRAIDMIENCKDNIPNNTDSSPKEFQYKLLSHECMISLKNDIRFDLSQPIKYTRGNDLIEFNIDQYQTVLAFYSLAKKDHSILRPFSASQFYEMLILVAKKYKEVGGLTGEKVVSNG